MSTDEILDPGGVSNYSDFKFINLSNEDGANFITAKSGMASWIYRYLKSW